MDTRGDALPSLNEMIDPNKEPISYSKVNTVQSFQPGGQTSQVSYSRTTQENPSQSQTSTYVTKKVITTTTTTRGGGNPSTQTNVTRYSNTNTTSYGGNRNQTSTTNTYTRPGGVPSSQSYTGNKYQPKRPEVSYNNNRARSPEPGTYHRKTINRGKPVENVQITHIIYTSRPPEFHLKENLDMQNLNKQPIQISKADRMKLQKSGKVSSTCSCDGVDIAPPKKANLKGTTTIYQHAGGIGMTNEKGNVNPMFYTSQIKKLQPISKKKEPEKIENIENFRSKGKAYNNSVSPSKTTVKNSTYNRGGMNSSSTQKRTYNSGSMNNYNRGGGMGSSTKTTTTTTTTTKVYRGGNNMDGEDGEIVKETKTRVQMGSRSQYNQTKPTTYTTTEKQVISQKNFFNK